jgi:hypothetical protein
MDRKSIGKRVRFEVFKRDSFTCQYCGQKAPEVVLEVDHISPVAGGGSDDIVNLVTACRGCNAGKSDKRLSDSSAVEKSRAQAEDIQERRRQLEMIAEWHRSLMGVEDHAVDQLEKLWLECIDSEPGVCLTDKARDSLRKACKSFGFDAVCAMIVEVAGKLAERGEADEEVARNKAFWSIARILGAKKADEGDPGISRLLYIRGIFRNRLNYVNERDCVAMLREARDAGINVDWLEWHAKRAFSWSRFRDIVSEALRETYEAGSEGDGDGTDS